MEQVQPEVIFFCAGANCPGLPYRASDRAHPPTCCASLHERVANALGWTLAEAQSFSLQSLREVVRPVSAKLAHELNVAIRSGSYIVSAPLRTRGSR